jgi:WD40 repeat protein
MADGTSFASWFTDKSSALNVCDLQTGQMLLTNVSHHDRSNAKFGSDGRRLASFPYQEHKGTVKVWDVKTGQLLQDFDGPPSPIVNVAFNHDGTRLAIGGSKWIYISNTQTGQLLLSLEENKRDRLYAGGIAFSPDGKKLASTLSGTLKVWDASR